MRETNEDHDDEAKAPRNTLAPEILHVLRKTDPRRWHAYAIVLDAESTPRLTLRGELAASLRANDLGKLADEATNRHVPRGAILSLVVDAAGPRFRILCDPRKAATR